MKYDLPTRLLHALLAVGVVIQLFGSLVMVTPKPGRVPNMWFEVHETVGIGLLAVLVLHWLWSLGRGYRGDLGMLVPWFRGARLAALWDDARKMIGEVASFKIPSADTPRPVAGAIQGLGLIIATFMAASGTIWSLGVAPDGSSGSLIHAIKEMHETVAPLMWGYLIIHPSIAIIHQLAGHDILSTMFGPGWRRSPRH